MTPDRRTFLTHAGLAALAVGTSALAGCSGPSAPRPSASSTAVGPVRVPSADVPVGSGTLVDSVVITQPQAGTFKAFSRECTHQQCPVSAIRGDTIHCDCHGSEYSVADGSVTKGPAENALTEYAVTVEGDHLTVTAS